MYIMRVSRTPRKIHDLTVLAFMTFTFPLNGSTLNRLFFRRNDASRVCLSRIHPSQINKSRFRARAPLCSLEQRLHYARATRYIAPRDKPEAFLSRRSLTRTTGDRKGARFYSHAENRAAPDRPSVISEIFSIRIFQGRTSTLERAFAKSPSGEETSTGGGEG